MLKKLILAVTMILLMLFVYGCGDPAEPGKPVKTEDPQGRLPPEIEAWVENSLDMFLGQSFEYKGKLYLLVTYGEKPTGGYKVEITDISELDNKLVVTAFFTEPGEDEMVTEALTYPYDMAVIEDPGFPVEFVAAGAEQYLPTLYGLKHLLPITAGSQWIKLFSPDPGETVPRRFTVEGVANVFEGNVLYQLADAGGEELAAGYTTGAMGDWGYFIIELNIGNEIESGTGLLLELYTESPKDGSVRDLVQLELSIGK